MEEAICNGKIKSLPEIITLTEHTNFADYQELIMDLNIGFCETAYESTPKYLGIHPHTLCASYYIGADWLVVDKHAVVVTPKMSNLDFIEMFVCALKFEPVANYFSKFYGIDFNGKPIKTSVFNNQITPLIIIHFIALLKNITKRGLKKAYVIREENLQSKVKGKIKISQHIKQNIIPKREDRIYCQYQEYTVDNLENRILKKALLYAESYLNDFSSHKSFATLTTTINNIKSSFIGVSDRIELYELKSITNNKLFKEYWEGIRIAKMILRKFNYSISDTKFNSDFTPPFWIDMSRLYEVYVYSKLFEKYGDDIKFQISGYYKTAVDFIDIKRKIIIDTKYKPQYNDSNGHIIDDIRQISAYARDKKILSEMKCDTGYMADCLIIYPKKMINNTHNEDNDFDDTCAELRSFDNIDELLTNATPVNGYEKFYKLSFPMPLTNYL
jgi:5-methylcytosine-specific restriction enzyme subunit McrC